MTPTSHPKASFVVILGALLLGGCARTGIGLECPQGFEPVNGTCVCDADEGCPTGYVCRGGTCLCDSDVCCPAGYHWDSQAHQCACAASNCCPAHYTWDNAAQACACAAADCCPAGFALDPATGRCGCDGDQCCPQGFVFVTDGGADGGALDGGPVLHPDAGVGAEFGMCACNDDSCCPVDYRWDGTRGACVCAKSECCPTDYSYRADVLGCICTGNACCPSGYVQDPTRGRCVCTSDAVCGPGNYCDPVSGSCLCRDNSACPTNQYCNGLGFCQTLSDCTANGDCPAGMFCDVTTSTCTPNGICTLDSNCPFGQICDLTTGQCATGCRTTDDCPLQNPGLSCQNGQCVVQCETNDFCPFQEFCGSHTQSPGCGAGQCCAPSNPPDPGYCQACDQLGGTCPGEGQPGGDACLQFIVEGQTETFCGVPCSVPTDCPSGYDCGPTLTDCSMNMGFCPDSPSGPATCLGFNVENMTGLQYLCADSATGQPAEYQSYCAPRSGICPAH
jgi:hypothetical protein